MCVCWNNRTSVVEYAEKLAEETTQKLLVIQWHGTPLFNICLPKRLEIVNHPDVTIHHETANGTF